MSATTTKLLRHSAIYGVGSILIKFSGFLLIPLYTRFLSPAQYGILATGIVLTSILGIVLGLGLDGALVRFHIEWEDDKEKLSRALSSLFYTLLAFAFVVTVALLWAGHALTSLHTINGVPFEPYLRIVIWTAFWSTFGLLPLALCMVQKRSALFSILNLSRFLINTGVTIYLVVTLRRGALGSLEGNLVAAVCFAGVSLWLLRPYLRRAWDGAALQESLRYSLPLLPHALSNWALNVSDRLILGLFLSQQLVGVYSLGYNLGMGMSVVVSSFMASWSPLFFETMKRGGDAPRELGRTVTHVLSGLILLALGGALVSREMVHIMATPDFYGAARVIPPVILGYFLQGVYICFVNVLFYYKKTSVLPLVTGGATICNIVANLLLVPRYGIIAAAWNTALAYGITAVLVFILSRRLLRLEVDWERLVILASLALGFFFLVQWVQPGAIGTSLALKGVLFAMFTVALFLGGVLPSALMRKMAAKMPFVRKRGAGRGGMA